MSKTLEGMARASVDADGCDGDYDKNPPEIRDALATDMKRALLYLADNVSDEMVSAFWDQFYSVKVDSPTNKAIAAALRAAAGEVAAFKKVAAASAALHQADTSEIAKLKAERDRLKVAISPFAAIKADDGDTFDTWHDDVVIRCEITVRDLKQARGAGGCR